jgi:hypothetical protein
MQSDYGVCQKPGQNIQKIPQIIGTLQNIVLYGCRKSSQFVGGFLIHVALFFEIKNAV